MAIPKIPVHQRCCICPRRKTATFHGFRWCARHRRIIGEIIARAERVTRRVA